MTASSARWPWLKKLDHNLVGTFNDMIVCHHVAIFRDHKPGAKRRTAPLSVALITARATAILKFSKEFFERRSLWHNPLRPCASRNHSGGRDIDHRWTDFLCQIGKTVRSALCQCSNSLDQYQRRRQT
jgi:hypothetical protein